MGRHPGSSDRPCRCRRYRLDGPLTCEEKSLIVESLNYTIQAFENYAKYPSREFQRQRIAEAEAARDKVRALHKQAEDE